MVKEGLNSAKWASTIMAVRGDFARKWKHVFSDFSLYIQLIILLVFIIFASVFLRHRLFYLNFDFSVDSDFSCIFHSYRMVSFNHQIFLSVSKTLRLVLVKTMFFTCISLLFSLKNVNRR